LQGIGQFYLLRNLFMKRYRNSIYYIGVIGFFTLLIYLIGQLGKGWETGRHIVPPILKMNHWDVIIRSFTSNLSHPLIILFAQIIFIILITRIFGWICKKLRQPVVIGEILAGILIGPSLLGYYFPEFSATLFPEQSLGNLHILAQIGLVLFMFMVGMELDFNSLKKKAWKAVMISHSGIVFSFTLGMILATFLYSLLAPPGIPFISFALFLGISVSITAFPVLARIMQERGMHKTELGLFVITCAAVDDITAWSLLAVVIAIVKAGSFVSAIPTILLSGGYVLIMLKVVRPFLSRIGELHTSRESLTKPIVALFFLVLMLSAFATEFIGIHAIFGGFMAGAIMPDNVKFRNIFIEKVEDVALVLFLPLFFVYTGLRTEITLLNDPGLWRITLIIILTAIAGKFLGATLSSKLMGQSWKNSVTIGTLMNSRGLVELVVLNIGFDLGVFSKEIFAMLVIMALVTTFMTAPVLDLITRLFGSKPSISSKETEDVDTFNLLLSFGNPERGKSMIRLADTFVRNSSGESMVTALHLSPVDDMFQTYSDDYEKESFSPLIKESQELHLPVKTIFKVSNNIESDIAEMANKGDYDMLIMGVGQSIYEGSLLGKVIDFTSKIINPAKLYYRVTGKDRTWPSTAFDERTRTILSRTEIPVGVFIDNNMSTVRRAFVLMGKIEDAFLIRYAQMLLHKGDISVSVYFAEVSLFQDIVLNSVKYKVNTKALEQFEILTNVEIRDKLFQNCDLMLVSAGNWANILENQHKWLFNIPSVLILTS
jgi:Kef-type K+ transport system membrane component KefB